MKNEQLLKLKTYFLIILLALFSVIANTVKAQSNQVITATRLYDSLRSHSIEHPKTVLAIAIYETGWMSCKSCALQQNNLFGFRTNEAFLKFSDIYESIKYLKRWQTRYYEPW